MPIISRDQHTDWRKYSPLQSLGRFIGWLGFVVLFVTAWQVMNAETYWDFVLDAPEQGAILFNRMFPPDWAYANRLWGLLWDTVNIATLGTLLGMLIATPLAFLAAHNTTPSRLFIRPLALSIIVASRSINSLIWAMLFVAIFGPGVLAGILAIAMRSIGFIGKLTYEAIEEISTEPVEAVEATGASGLQILDYAIIPQVLPAYAGISVLRWDINIREATVLGLVGAGGIGIELSKSLDTINWSGVSMILLMILGTVVVSEWVSARIRHALI
ncbi:MAG: phosphonate ABC transporter, permease protein PhnE [Thioalkalivibrionaceae bacterium]